MALHAAPVPLVPGALVDRGPRAAAQLRPQRHLGEVEARGAGGQGPGGPTSNSWMGPKREKIRFWRSLERRFGWKGQKSADDFGWKGQFPSVARPQGDFQGISTSPKSDLTALQFALSRRCKTLLATPDTFQMCVTFSDALSLYICICIRSYNHGRVRARSETNTKVRGSNSEAEPWYPARRAVTRLPRASSAKGLPPTATQASRRCDSSSSGKASDAWNAPLGVSGHGWVSLFSEVFNSFGFPKPPKKGCPEKRQARF